MLQKSTGKVKFFKEKLKIYSGEDRAVLMHLQLKIASGKGYKYTFPSCHITI